MPRNWVLRAEAQSFTRSANLPPRSMRKKLTVPEATKVGFVPVPSERSSTIPAGFPSTVAAASGAGVYVATPAADSAMVPKCAGPAARTMELPGALPTVLSPAWRKCRPMRVSQPSDRVSSATLPVR